MNLLKYLFFFSLILSSFHCFAQQKMLLLNGKEIEIKSYTVGEPYISYTKANTKHTKTKTIEKYDVFSITKEDGTEDLIYKADTLTFSVEEARNYIRGEQAAMKYYHKPANKWAAAAVGVSSSILSFYSLPLPMLYGVVIGRFNPKQMQIPADVTIVGSSTEEFRYGYNKKARNLKIQQSLKWGYIGLGVGLAGLIVYGVTNH